MRRSAIVGLAVWVVLALSAPARAWLMASNQRLDRALWREHEAPLVVAGRIAKVELRDPKTWDEGPDLRAIDFDVGSVVLGPVDAAPRTLHVRTGSFDWPEDLVVPREGATCVLLLDARGMDQPDTLALRSVVPSRSATLERAADVEAAKRVLARELLALLAAETDAARRRALVRQVGPILTAEESAALLPFLGSEDAWLRRAVLAGLAAATRRRGFVELAADDVRHFLATTRPDDLIQTAPGIRTSPYWLLESHYFVLDTSWSPDDRAPAFLPLWRAVAETMRGDEVRRWMVGVRPLCHLGEERDLALLLDYRAWFAGEGGAAVRPNESWRATAREELQAGIARIQALQAPTPAVEAPRR